MGMNGYIYVYKKEAACGRIYAFVRKVGSLCSDQSPKPAAWKKESIILNFPDRVEVVPSRSKTRVNQPHETQLRLLQEMEARNILR